MARRIPDVNGNAPPPSTLAAQIVQNQTGSAPQQNGGAEIPLKSLLNEILTLPDTAQETDIAVNVKLVHVVAEAGLSPLATLDPFANHDAVLSEAADSIAVIAKTIKRKPEVLLTPIVEGGPQLVLLLVSRLVSICGKPKTESLQIAELLDTAIRALLASLELWTAAAVVESMCTGIVEECLSILEAQKELNTPFSCTVPSAKTVAKLWPQAEAAIATPYRCQETITSHNHAFMLALALSTVESLDREWRYNVQLRLQMLLAAMRKRLTAVKQWETALLQLLSMDDHLLVLQHILADLDNVALSQAAQEYITKTLVTDLRIRNGLYKESLIAYALAAAKAKAFDNLGDDMRIAIATWLVRCLPEHELPPDVLELRDMLQSDDSMLDAELRASFLRLSTPSAGVAQHRRKRRRLSPESVPRPNLSDSLRSRLLHDEGQARSDMSNIATSMYTDLDEAEQCRVWRILRERASIQPELVAQTITALLQSPALRAARRPRIEAMLAIQTIARSTTKPVFLQLNDSHIGRYCISSVHSSLRELRIAAGKCLPLFLRDDLPAELLRHNRHIALEYLRQLSDQDAANEHETLIPVWAEVGFSCGDRELNLALLRLVEYLGNPNPLICAVAHAEIDRLATLRDQTVGDMFKPFWSTIAISVVQDLTLRPQKAQHLCDLLGTNVSELLLSTQHHTIPTLLLSKKKDILQKLAAARQTTIQDLFMQPTINFVATFATLLLQPVNDPEEAGLACLVEVTQSFRNLDNMTNLIKVHADAIACEMLTRTGDVADNRKPRMYRAIQIFTNIVQRRQGQSKSEKKSNKAMYGFVEEHALPMMARLSEVIESGSSAQLNEERLRCVKGIKEMIHLAKSHVSVALSQLRATLQSAMTRPELREVALAAWLQLLVVLEGEDVEPMIGQTFALILQYWDSLTPELHHTIHSNIAELIRTHQRVVQDSVMTLPSLKSIPLLSKFGAEIEHLRAHESPESHCKAFEQRLRDESLATVRQALRELLPFLVENQEFLHDAAVSEQPVLILSLLMRALLDVDTKFASRDVEVAELCGSALGAIGCLDSNRVEASRPSKQVLVLSNFEKASETLDWAVVLLEDVLVKSFRSVTNARSQGFVAYVLQEMLRSCGFRDAVSRTRSSQGSTANQKWLSMPEHVRITLTPFLSSHYHITNAQTNPPQRTYPGFSMDANHSSWLRSLVYDLMWRAKGDNAKMIFPLLARLVRNNDIGIATFMLPYVVMNVVVGGTVTDVRELHDELLAVLQCEPMTNAQTETAKQGGEAVFKVLDYMSAWLQEKKRLLSQTRADAFRTGISPGDFDEISDMDQIKGIEQFLAELPAEAIATRAIQCGSYARALFNWEQHIRQHRTIIPSPQTQQDDQSLYGRLHDIYACIDEPDGLEGLGAHLSFLTEEQQAVQHAKAGRWTAASAWYEAQLAEESLEPGEKLDLQVSLLKCFRETGQYASMQKYSESFLRQSDTRPPAILSMLAESDWMTGTFSTETDGLAQNDSGAWRDMSIAVRTMLDGITSTTPNVLAKQISAMRVSIAQSMTESGTTSIQACHDELRNLHALHEIEALTNGQAVDAYLKSADKRLAVLGSYNSDKVYLLGIRRAFMQARSDTVVDAEIAPLWLSTARLARKAGNSHHAYHAVLQAHACGDRTAKLEEARLLWHDGHQRQAIQSLQSAIDARLFEPSDDTMEDSGTTGGDKSQNLLVARAHLMLAKWLDTSGQSQAKDMQNRYQFAAKNFQRWEKGHYYLGKHYSKLLEAEKTIPSDKQSLSYRAGEMTKSVIENLMRSIPFGNKYWHETIPKVLTLWLDLGLELLKKPARGEDPSLHERRQKALQAVNKQFQKYYERIPAYVFYTALPQMVSRISHPHPDVWKQLLNCLMRIVQTHPSQALWYMLPVLKATDRVRAERGMEILNKLKDPKRQAKGEVDLRSLIVQSQKMADALLQASERHVEPKRAHISLAKDLDFNVKLAPLPLVVPVETSLMANIPLGANTDTIRKHKAFAQDKVTIAGFTDDVLVLSSLQRPRKINVRGSDGKLYGLLCKPKDDLRKDQRLMDFNGIINRALKRDAESSKRRLYIKTYAVTPLSEESGTLEWVEGIKPMRDILTGVYSRKGQKIDYHHIKAMLEQQKTPSEHAQIFVDEVLPQFPPLLHEWFTETFSDPETWFIARLRYTRTAAVMSIVGHILGLGDRHGENILLQEGTGGVFHVDFNCLFDKGRTFEKPELVPFRLTHNMVDAMGAYGYEGPFRKSAELTLAQLRQNKDTLMTILETFLYDPTTDFIGNKKKKNTVGVPETPQEILDSVARKLKGLLIHEHVPLGVEGYVDALIQEATSHANLAAMYIGWCAFL
ncbi:serine/threonine-protein kinase M1 [Recurvomyces mirabilis]|uniref:non-specific serine/threonine protein kinase n=1 Tax=Recurvomyces mirabilis TaxID=574656 RepID=A0AAE1C5Z3_9PEZI|nr:serine/threonine-protein kinase M1 [Recurvomyces mirabilis]KAK5158905.1 serine/threonine-protein kinase M1 [Recurvomyces mirabilis]